MQHTEMLLVFVDVVVTVFLVTFLLSRRLLRRRIVRDWFAQCRLQALAEILKVSQGSSCRFEVLNLHLPLPLDQESKL